MQSTQKQTLATTIGAFLIIIVFVTTLWPENSRKNSTAEIPTETFAYIQAMDLYDLLQKEPLPIILDIRTQSEFQYSHIQSSINIKPENIDNITKNLPQNAKIILVSSQSDAENLFIIAKRFKDANIDSLILTGGYESWQLKALPAYNQGDPDSTLDQSKVYPVSIDRAKSFITGKYPPILLDVRTEQSFQQKYIQGSINIPLEKLYEQKNKIPLGKEIIVYGENDLESFQAGVRLFDMGILTAKTLTGGYNDLVR